ncbi:MAG TPA: ATP-binding protein [Acidimicrobiales bacterium]|nr:ATP-binding protein [Acidimicrobiales bacterium]
MELNWAARSGWGDDQPSTEVPPLAWPDASSVHAGAFPPPAPSLPGAGPASPNGTPNASAAEEPADESAPSAPYRRGGHSWLRKVSFRSRVTVLVAAAVGVAVAMAALSSYIAVSHQMEQQAAQDLNADVSMVPVQYLHGALPANLFYNLASRTGDKVQVIESGQIISVQSSGYTQDLVTKAFFKLTQAAQREYASQQPGLQAGNRIVYSVQTEDGSDGHPYLVATIPVSAGQFAVQLGYGLSNTENTLAFLRLMLVLVALCGVALAATLGWAVGRACMGPVEQLTLAAEHVAETQDLESTIEESGNDELARLAHSFNAMLAALATSRHQQAQLVSDAGHELRTPLTSLRTNIEVLMRAKDLKGTDREELLADVDAQLKELTTLVGDLVDLARDDEHPPSEPVPVPFDQIVYKAVERAQRRAMSVHFELSLDHGDIMAQPSMLERAVMNVLDNAAKWSPRGGRVEVTLRANGSWQLTVADQGPGIAAEDLPHIFDRFYRAQSARSMPGSGLGLAIVKGVVASLGGTIQVGNAPGGGTRVDIALPLEQVGTSGAPVAQAEVTSSDDVVA